MWETILGAVSSVIPNVIADLMKSIFHMFRKKREKSSLRQEYELLRRMAAEALTMNACYYCNPVDIAQHGNSLPEAYRKGSNELRALGAKFKGFAETLPDGVCDIPLSKAQIAKVGNNFIGLSNSFNTPYQCPNDRGSVQSAREMEKVIRNLLGITKIK